VKIRAAVLEEFGQPLVVQSVELEEPKAGEALDVVRRLLIAGRRIADTSFGGVKGRSQAPGLVDRWLAGEIDVDRLLTDHVRLDDVNEAFHAMERQEGIRTVIEFA